MLKALKSIGRHLLYHPRGMKIGASSCVRLPRIIFNPERITIGNSSLVLSGTRLEAYDHHSGGQLDGHIVIGDGVYIGYNCMLCATGLISIGDGCVLSDGVFIEDGAHGIDPEGPPLMEQPLETKGPIIIGRRCLLGYGCSVLSGVTLGDHCVVGTRSVVTKSFPAYSMIAGSPAKCIKVYDRERKAWVRAAATI